MYCIFLISLVQSLRMDLDGIRDYGIRNDLIDLKGEINDHERLVKK